MFLTAAQSAFNRFSLAKAKALAEEKTSGTPSLRSGSGGKTYNLYFDLISNLIFSYFEVPNSEISFGGGGLYLGRHDRRLD